ncbi:MAG: hypothetical protein C1943_17835 [Halochromatium sp.]|nr:hypothetical protein [Halochromatium sp.]
MRLGVTRLTRPERWQRLSRELWQRRLPHGLLSPRYLWPGQDRRIRAHRALWWRAGVRWPRPLWLLLQLALYLRWLCVSGPWLSLRAWRRWRAEEPDRYPPRSLWVLLRLTLGWCIPPHACQQFDLLARPGQALDYVYDHELPAYHAARSAPLGRTREQAQCLQDKVVLTETLAALGIPMAPILRHIPRDAPNIPFATLMPEAAPVFCKTRSGNQGRGAFAAWPTAHGWAGKTFSGQRLVDTQAVEAAWQALRTLDNVLIQPRLDNHPLLARLTESPDAITVRYITRWRGEQIDCLQCVLEVPLGADAEGDPTRYGILPIDPGTGVIQPWPFPARLPQRARVACQCLFGLSREHPALPDWPSLIDSSHRAQAQFRGIWAIAWDWVLTADGPTLLEGNVGWGAAVPQQLQGGWLVRNTEEAPADCAK